MESEPPPQRVEGAEETAPQPQSGLDATGSATRWWAPRPDPLLLVCFAVLFAFPLAAALAASRQPVAPEPQTAARPAAAALGPTVRDVPAFTPGGEVAAAVGRGRLLTDLPTMRRALDAADLRGGFNCRDASVIAERDEQLALQGRAFRDNTKSRYPGTS